MEGWKLFNGKWRFFKKELLQIGWFKDGERWYYSNKNGDMQVGWIKDGERWFYLQENTAVENSISYKMGQMRKGWLKLGYDWYYLLEETKASKGEYKGQALINTTKKINNKCYNFDEEGKWNIVTLRQLINFNWINATTVLKDLNNTLRRFSIDTPKRLQHFMSQCGYESNLGAFTIEQGNNLYFIRNYEDRKDLGNIYEGDGIKYRGGGFIQLTGRRNYQTFANFIGDDKIMEGAEYVANKYPFMTAGFYWYNRNINNKCDKGATCREITYLVNGGYNGLANRERLYNKAKEIFI